MQRKGEGDGDGRTRAKAKAMSTRLVFRQALFGGHKAAEQKDISQKAERKCYYRQQWLSKGFVG